MNAEPLRRGTESGLSLSENHSFFIHPHVLTLDGIGYNHERVRKICSGRWRDRLLPVRRMEEHAIPSADRQEPVPPFIIMWNAQGSPLPIVITLER